MRKNESNYYCSFIFCLCHNAKLGGRANSMELMEKSQEKRNKSLSEILTINIFLSEHKSGKPHYSWWYSFEVCIYENLTFADRLTFCQPIRSGMPSTFWTVFLTAFSRRFNSYFANHRRKNAPKKLAPLQANRWQGKRWITISTLVCWRNNSLFTPS